MAEQKRNETEWQTYERMKRELRFQTPAERDKAIRELCAKLRI